MFQRAVATIKYISSMQIALFTIFIFTIFIFTIFTIYSSYYPMNYQYRNITLYWSSSLKMAPHWSFDSASQVFTQGMEIRNKFTS